MGYLQFVQMVRVANTRIRTARDLDARWKGLGPEGQEEARAEWDTLKAAVAALRERIEAGPRGFVREFNAARRGEEAEPIAAPRPLGTLIRELQDASTALRDKLDAVEQVQQAQASPPQAAPPQPAEAEVPQPPSQTAS